MGEVVVLDYDPTWSVVFERLRSDIWSAISDLATTIEHIGSTSVEGLPAKPVIDMMVVVPVESRMPLVIDRLATIGYRHRGDLGVPGREAFARPDGTPAHHLYACVEGNLGLRNHLAIRDHLRRHPATAQAYGELKKQLAAQCPHDIDAYIDGKTRFILEILAEAGFTQAELDEIRAINSKP
jgi:GrpB-like predicted nucleotidyltransferase (UPF0157 family)